jgi:hypothetical protein
MPVIAHIPFRCPRVADCRSEQCPLDPSHSVEKILSRNEYLVSESTRLRLAAKYSAGQYLPYDGRTRDEYLKIVNGLQIRLLLQKLR